jgi:hypothetical protein
VLDCAGGGSLSSLLAGIEWVAGHLSGPSVAVMAWSFEASPALDTAIRGLAERGVLVVASAGNTGGDDCAMAPRSVPGVLVVANTTVRDRRAPTSSTGPCVDLYAPGTAIVAPTSGAARGAGRAPRWPRRTRPARPRCTCSTSATRRAPRVERWIVGNATPASSPTPGAPSTPAVHAAVSDRQRPVA